MYVSCRNVLWIVSLVLILAIAEYGLGIQAARPLGDVPDFNLGATPGASSPAGGAGGRDSSSDEVGERRPS